MIYLLRPCIIVSCLLLGSGCASLGGNISGDFSCRAPNGRCSPTESIDNDALAQIEKESDGSSVNLLQKSSLIARRGERNTLAIIFPKRVDNRGRIHGKKIVEARVQPRMRIAAPAEVISQSPREFLVSAAAASPAPSCPAADNLSGRAITRASVKAEVDALLAKSDGGERNGLSPASDTASKMVSAPKVFYASEDLSDD